MMVGAVLLRVPWAAIPVPDIGRTPPLWSPPPLSLVGGGLAILAVLAFVFVVFSAGRFFECGISPWRLMIVTGVVFAIGVALWHARHPGDESGEAIIFAMASGGSGAMIATGAQVATGLAERGA